MSVEFRTEKPTITSYGGNGGMVTGSCHVFDSGLHRVVVDCGIIQGTKDREILGKMEEDNDKMLDQIFGQKNPVVLISHDHADHVSRLPYVFKRGYTPIIYTTELTKKIIEKTLMESARAKRRYDSLSCSYEVEDVKNTLRYIRTVDPFEETPITKDGSLRAIFCLNGHTPGSSSIVIKDLNSGENVLFTGDIGRPEQLLTGGFRRFASKYPDDPINVIFTESTGFPYKPIPFEKRVKYFQRELIKGFSRGGTILMPCIKHRHMENLEIIHNSQKKGELPRDIQFFRDGPSLDTIFGIYEELVPRYLTKRYGDNPEYYTSEEQSKSRFNLNQLQRAVTHQDSINLAELLNYSPRKAIVFASGGMGEDGRVLNYFRNGFMRNPKNTVIFSCFQVDGTNGAKLLEEQDKPGYSGAKIVRVEGGSSHATGEDETFEFFGNFNTENLRTVIIGHGEDYSRKMMEISFKKRGYEYIDIKLPEIRKNIVLN